MEVKEQITVKFNDEEKTMLAIFYEQFNNIREGCMGHYTDCNHCPFNDLCRLQENSCDVDDFVNSIEEEMSVVFESE